tara:strand:- start:678 stop:938 length:261 start_codon:yes stop_codon:yes gene_type:complete
MTGIKMKADRVLIESVKAPKKTASGITNVDDGIKINEGVILAVGPLVENAKVGDKVIYEEFGYIDVTIDGRDYVSTKEELLIAERE